MTEYQIHVCALLGKALRDGNVSREFENRLTKYVEVLQNADPSKLYTAICGGKGEAPAAMGFLERNHLNLLPPDARRFEDLLSENTIQNFDALGRYLACLLSPENQRIRLTVVSSEYHIKRIQFVDKHLKPQSLVNSINLAVHPRLLDWEPADYLPLDNPNPTVKWFAEVYTSVERLLPLQINIEGILDSRINRIMESVYSEFDEGHAELKRLVSSASSLREIGYDQEVDPIEDAVHQLSSLSPSLASTVETIGGSGRLLSLFLNSLRSAIKQLRYASDLDQKNFDSLF